MSNLRSGAYGNYYGSYFDESVALSTAQQKVNVTYIYNYLRNNGWTVNAISALVGNMQAESSINPGRWQSNNVGGGPAYGLVQWDPFTKYTEWCYSEGYSDPSEMDNNLKRILYELENKIQWYATSSYDFSFSEFSKSTQTPEYLAKAFLLNYERPADQSASVQTYRGSLARTWYEFLTSGEIPDIPDPEQPEISTDEVRKWKKGFNFVLFNRKRFNRNV